MRFLGLFFLINLSFSICYAFDLAELAQKALEKQTGYRAEQARLQASDAVYAEKKGHFYPTLNLQGSYLKAQQIQPTENNITTENYTVTMRQSLYQPDQWQEINLAEQQQFRQKVMVHKIRQNFLAEVGQTYLAVCKAQAIMVLAQDYLKAAGQMVEFHKKLWKAGQRSQADFLEIELDYLNQQSTFLRIKQDLSQKWRDFNLLLKTNIKIETLGCQQPHYSFWTTKFNAQKWEPQKDWQTNNDDYQLVKIDAEIARENYQKSYNTWKPKLDLTFAHRSSINAADTIIETKTNTAALEMTMYFSPVVQYQQNLQSWFYQQASDLKKQETVEQLERQWIQLKECWQTEVNFLTQGQTITEKQRIIREKYQTAKNMGNITAHELIEKVRRFQTTDQSLITSFYQILEFWQQMQRLLGQWDLPQLKDLEKMTKRGL